MKDLLLCLAAAFVVSLGLLGARVLGEWWHGFAVGATLSLAATGLLVRDRGAT